jgi:hypothetical protein
MPIWLTEYLDGEVSVCIQCWFAEPGTAPQNCLARLRRNWPVKKREAVLDHESVQRMTSSVGGKSL